MARRWSNTSDPAWADMADTELTDDLSSGDTTTGETGGASDEAPNGCRYLYASSYLTVEDLKGSVYSTTGISWRITLTATLEAV